MPRHFAKRMYGPYFPYDHGPHGCDEKKCDHNSCKNKKENIFKKIFKKINISRA